MQSQETVTTKEIAARAASRYGRSISEVERVTKEVMREIGFALSEGKRVRLYELGTLAVKTRKARNGRNPSTGAQIEIPAGRRVAFSAAKTLKEAM